MRIPRIVIVLLVSTAAYLALAAWWHDDPESRPLEDPYRLLPRLERDGVLRSVHFGQRVAAQRQQRSWSFDRERATRDEVEATGGVRARFHDGGLVENTGSLELERPEDAQGFVLDLPIELGAEPSFVVEGRLRLAGPEAALGVTEDAGSYRVELALAPSPQDASGRTVPLPRDGARVGARGDPGPSPALARLVVSPWMSTVAGPESAPAIVEDLPAARWLDFRLAACRPLVEPSPAPSSLISVRLLIATSARTLHVDELRVRPGARIDGLLSRGHARGFGATESTRELERVVARGADERLCLLMPAPTTLTYAFTVPRAAHLDFAVSALAETASFGSAQLSVALRRPGEFEIALQQIPVGTVDVSRFTAHRIELGAYSGEEVELQFRALDSGDPRPPVVLLADPVIRSTRPDDTLPHVFLVTFFDDAAGHSSTPAAADPFELLRSRGVALTRGEPTADREAELLALLTSRPVPPRPPRSVPDPALRIPSLAGVLAEHGYRTFASTGEARDGWLLAGFARRWNGGVAGAVDGAIRWFDRHREAPCFTWLQLPRQDSSRALRQLLDALKGRDALEDSVLATWPEVGGGSPALLCAPGLGEAAGTLEDFSTLDLAPTLLALLELPAHPSFAGRGWTVDALQGRARPRDPAPEPRRRRTAWSFAGAELPAFTTQVFDLSRGDRR